MRKKRKRNMISEEELLELGREAIEEYERGETITLKSPSELYDYL